MPSIEIRALANDIATRDALADILVETVANGGSVSFMHPLPVEAARRFWETSLQSAEAGGRVVFGAMLDGELAATLSLVLDLPPNQPHRAELAKMMTRVSARRRGLAGALIEAAEAEATARGRSLVVLDTASDGGAAALYERHGYIFAGELPDYALKPHGGLTGTRLYWKKLAPHSVA